MGASRADAGWESYADLAARLGLPLPNSPNQRPAPSVGLSRAQIDQELLKQRRQTLRRWAISVLENKSLNPPQPEGSVELFAGKGPAVRRFKRLRAAFDGVSAAETSLFEKLVTVLDRLEVSENPIASQRVTDILVDIEARVTERRVTADAPSNLGKKNRGKPRRPRSMLVNPNKDRAIKMVQERHSKYSGETWRQVCAWVGDALGLRVAHAKTGSRSRCKTVEDWTRHLKWGHDYSKN